MQENGINWTVVATIAAPIITLLVGVVLNQALKSKPRLISYYGHASSFLIREGVEQPSRIHAHSVVLRNVGRKPAKNVRLGHNVLGNFQVYPNREYKIIELDGGGKEILFPELIAGEQVSVSYL